MRTLLGPGCQVSKRRDDMFSVLLLSRFSSLAHGERPNMK